MKKVLTVLLAVLTIAAIGNLQSTHAQNPDITPFQETFVGLHTSCTLSATGTAKTCRAGDGMWVSENGGAYYKLGPASAGGVLTVNGKLPDSKGNVSLAATTTVTSPTATTTLQ